MVYHQRIIQAQLNVSLSDLHYVVPEFLLLSTKGISVSVVFATGGED